MSRPTSAVVLAALPVLALLTMAPVAAVPPVPSHGQPSARAGGEVVVRPAALDRGPTPKVSWLAANVVHTPNGRTHTLPWTRKGAVDRDLTLWGRTPSGWVVSAFEAGVGERAWLVDGEERQLIDVVSASADERTWMVARDGTALAKRTSTGGSGSVGITRISDGEPLDDRDFDGEVRLLDFSGPAVLVGTESTTLLWTPGGPTEDLGVLSVAGHLGHDVLIVPGETMGTVGPTTISDPGPPAWTAPLERVEVSPDGRFVLGRVTGGDHSENHLEIRRVADGTLVASYDVRHLWRMTPQWESATSVIFLAARTGLGDVNALVRCTVKGTCTRATAWHELRALSLVRAPDVTRG